MKALVVDDDRVLADLVAFTLRQAGFSVRLAYQGETALALWRTEKPDLVVLDLNLPGVDGFAVCRHIRAEANTPIIMLTVRGEEDDIVRGLELGADDYVTKPFSPRQLVARVQAVLRRAEKPPTAAVTRVGDLILDPERRTLIGPSGVAAALTPLETRMLMVLMGHAGQVLSYDAIISHVWGPDGADQAMVRQLIRRLRLKIEPDPASPRYIETVAGYGYGLARPAAGVR